MRVGVSLDFQALDFKSRPLAQTKLTLKLFKCFKTLDQRFSRSCPTDVKEAVMSRSFIFYVARFSF